MPFEVVKHRELEPSSKVNVGRGHCGVDGFNVRPHAPEIANYLKGPRALNADAVGHNSEVFI